jgi:phosphopantetheine adenylyltransferase
MRGIEGQPEVAALVVSREVAPRAHQMNAYKAAARVVAALLPPLRALLTARLHGLRAYSLVVVDLVGQSATGKLSSTALRERDARAAGTDC